MKKALITGITGQDGYFLTKLLLKKDYEIHGIVRSNARLGNLSYLLESELKSVKLHEGDITDSLFIDTLVNKMRPDEVYHLASQSSVALSFKQPKHTFDVNMNSTLNLVNSIKQFSPNSKLYFAATSELFGSAKESPQNEETSFHPRSPYGVSKLAGYWAVKNYRESYNLFFCNGILFNHESEFRGLDFVTRKISHQVAEISKGVRKTIELGNIHAERDWGYAKDYVYGMWLMLQQEQPDDFILATGTTHSIKEFVEEAFAVINKKLSWTGEGIDEVGVDTKTGDILVTINPDFYRPAEINSVKGDFSKAKKKLNWEPKVTFNELIRIMVENDLKEL